MAGLASAAIDVSDGLTQDLGHILTASGVGARLWPDRLPRSAAAGAWPDQTHCECTEIGVIEAEPGLRGERTQNGSSVSYTMEQTGYEHFITTDSAS